MLFIIRFLLYGFKEARRSHRLAKHLVEAIGAKPPAA